MRVSCFQTNQTYTFACWIDWNICRCHEKKMNQISIVEQRLVSPLVDWFNWTQVAAWSTGRNIFRLYIDKYFNYCKNFVIQKFKLLLSLKFYELTLKTQNKIFFWSEDNNKLITKTRTSELKSSENFTSFISKISTNKEKEPKLK